MSVPNVPSDLRIAVFIHALDGGGAQRDAILLANAMSRADAAVTIVTLNADGRLAALVEPGVAVVTLAARRLRRAAVALRSELMRQRAHVLLSSEVVPNIVAFLATRLMPRRLRPRLVLREVAAPSIARREDPYPQSRAAYRFIGSIYARADQVLTLTEGARDDLVQNFGVPPDRVSALSCNAVIDPATVARLARLQPEQIPRESGLVVAVGRLSPEKDHLTLIEAMRLLPAHVEARLVFVGDGERRQRLESRVAELGLKDRIKFAGYDADPFAWLLKAELFVSSSRFEGFGNAIVEALACGTPVVATDCPFGPREILGGGQLGRLVPVGDPPALAAAVVEALSAPGVDRPRLMRRGAEYTTDRAAAAVLAAVGIGTRAAT